MIFLGYPEDPFSLVLSWRVVVSHVRHVVWYFIAKVALVAGMAELNVVLLSFLAACKIFQLNRLVAHGMV